jgi:hypothetical protein
VTGVLAGWLVWALLAWWLFGGRSRRSVHYSRRGRISRRVYF